MIWYPYEQMKTMKAPYKIVDAEGVYLYTEDNKMIDSISSWWSTIHGYKHPVITKAIKDQADKFSHVMLGGLTHDPALQLSAKLADWLPGDLDHCFFSDSGSVGVEVREIWKERKYWRCRMPTTGIRSRLWRSATTRIIILSWRRMEKRSMLSISRRRSRLLRRPSQSITENSTA